MIKEHLSNNRQILIPGNAEETLQFCSDDWIKTAQQAIKEKNSFFVALSGGSTPKNIFKKLVKEGKELDWSKIFLFWSDERAVSPNDPESNYYMAMVDAGLNLLPIQSDHIFRMQAESSLHENALAYEKNLKNILKDQPFDLIMLGMGEDGHTASLFPKTHALQVNDRLVIENEVPQKKCFRMTFTYPLINQAKKICFYIIGDSKAVILEKVLFGPFIPETYPSQKIGTSTHPATFIMDQAAARRVLAHI